MLAGHSQPTPQMTSSPKKPGVAFWATVVVVVGFIVYPLSLLAAIA